MEEKKVGIVLLNWNGLSDTLECLDSLRTLDYSNWVAIVVDNGSREPPDEIERRFPEVVLIRNASNEGYCGGNNIGIQRATDLGCDYTWVLNNDAVVTRDCLSRLVAVLEADPRIGALTNRINWHEQPELSWFSGGTFERGIPAHRGYFTAASVNAPLFSTEYLSGCSFVTRTEVLTALGGFDENFFCYVEDVDLSLRIRAAGHLIGYVDAAVVLHKISRATEHISHIKFYYKHRNMLYFLHKHRRPRSVARRWWMTSLYYTASLLLKHRNPKAAFYLLRGMLDGSRRRMGRLATAAP